MNERIFSGMYPTGIVYSDKWTIELGDYKKLAFLSYSTLELDIRGDCPELLKAEIINDAKTYQDRKGEYLEISSSGQTVLLGHALKSDKYIYIVVVSFYYNVSSITHTKRVEVEANNYIEAEEKVRKMFPHITSLVVEERV